MSAALVRHCPKCKGMGGFWQFLLLRYTTAHWSGSAPPGCLPNEEDHDRFLDLRLIMWPCECSVRFTVFGT